MQHTALPITPPSQAGPSRVSFPMVSQDVTEQYESQGKMRFPTDGTWVPELGFGQFDRARLVDIACTDQGGVVKLNDFQRSPDTNAAIPDVAVAQAFMYGQAAVCSDLGDRERERTGQILRRSMERTWPLALASMCVDTLISTATAVPEAEATGGVDTRKFSPKRAVAALDAALLDAGVYGGVIHVPAIFAAEIAGSFRQQDETYRTPLGSQLHVFPTSFSTRAGTTAGILNAQGDPLLFASGPVAYAQSDPEVFDGPNDGASFENGFEDDEEAPVYSGLAIALSTHRNAHRVFGSRYGAIIIDPASTFVVRSNSIEEFSESV